MSSITWWAKVHLGLLAGIRIIMDILLKDEEIHTLVAIELEKLNAWRKTRGVPPTTWLGELDPDIIAKAQLKKVVDYLWNECYGNPDELGYLRLNGEYWQALKREVE